MCQWVLEDHALETQYGWRKYKKTQIKPRLLTGSIWRPLTMVSSHTSISSRNKHVCRADRHREIMTHHPEMEVCSHMGMPKGLWRPPRWSAGASWHCKGEHIPWQQSSILENTCELQGMHLTCHAWQAWMHQCLRNECLSPIGGMEAQPHQAKGIGGVWNQQDPWTLRWEGLGSEE